MKPAGTLPMFDWQDLSAVLGPDLHPGGAAATARLHDRAKIGSKDSVLDIGCGTSGGKPKASRWIGVDRYAAPSSTSPAIVADGRRLPVADASIDVVLAECSLSLMEPRERTLSEARRVLRSGGRLAFADVTAPQPVQWTAPEYAELLCVKDPWSVGRWQDTLAAAGFGSTLVEDASEGLWEIEERAMGTVDVFAVLEALGRQTKAAWPSRLATFLRQCQSLRDDSRLTYHMFVAS